MAMSPRGDLSPFWGTDARLQVVIYSSLDSTYTNNNNDDEKVNHNNDIKNQWYIPNGRDIQISCDGNPLLRANKAEIDG